MPDEIKRLYLQKPVDLDRRIKQYLEHAELFSINRNGKSQTYLLQNSNKIMADLDKVIALYLKEAENNTKLLKRVELLIFISTLLALFFEAIFIFKPANRRIKQYTKDLIEQKDYFNTVIESSTNAIITLDKNLLIKTYNKMAEKIFGFTKQEMMNRSNFDKIFPEEYKTITGCGSKNFVAEINSSGEGAVVELQARRKNGEFFPAKVMFGYAGGDNDIAIIANIQDATHEKLNEQLLQQQAKFAALGEMIAIIAHQWRQPLAELSFNCIYISKHLQNPKLKDVVEKNENIIQFMSETISNFQDFYKTSEKTDFNPVISVNQVINIIKSMLELNNIELIQKIDSKVVIHGNPNSLAQVILSIMQNTIDVVRNQKMPSGVIELSLFDTDTEIVLAIEDNAGGIQIEPISDIFKPFKSKKQSPSTGIGLYMSKMIIENKFGGTIDAENTDNGAKFTIRLPH